MADSTAKHGLKCSHLVRRGREGRVRSSDSQRTSRSSAVHLVRCGRQSRVLIRRGPQTIVPDPPPPSNSSHAVGITDSAGRHSAAHHQQSTAGTVFQLSFAFQRPDLHPEGDPSASTSSGRPARRPTGATISSARRTAGAGPCTSTRPAPRPSSTGTDPTPRCSSCSASASTSGGTSGPTCGRTYRAGRAGWRHSTEEC